MTESNIQQATTSQTEQSGLPQQTQTQLQPQFQQGQNLSMQRVAAAQVAPASTAGSATFGQDTPAASTPVHQAPTRVMILIPIRSNMDVDLRWATNGLYKILGQAPPGTGFLSDWRYGIAETREQLVNMALAATPVPGQIPGVVSHILFLDSDVIPLTESIVNQMVATNLPILSGIYYNTLYTGLAAWAGPQHQPITLQQPSDLVECDDVGFGFCMIKREVFEALQKNNESLPWFHYAASANKFQSEDFYFLEKAKKYGYKPVVDMRLRAGHLRKMIMNVDGSASVI